MQEGLWKDLDDRRIGVQFLEGVGSSVRTGSVAEPSLYSMAALGYFLGFNAVVKTLETVPFLP